MNRWWLAASAVLALGASGCGDDGEKANVARGAGEIRVSAIDAFYNPGQPVTTIEARFSAKDPALECTTTTHGGCEVLDCPSPGGAKLQAAGTLSVSTADASVQRDVEQNADGEYTLGEAALLFQEGDALTVAASGADVPAFSVDAAFPPKLEAVEPLLSESENTLLVGHDQDTPVRVSGGTAGMELWAELRGTRATMRCIAPAEDGEVVLSGEAIEAAGGGVVDVRGVTRATTSAGSYDVTLLVFGAVMQEERRLVLTTAN